MPSITVYKKATLRRVLIGRNAIELPKNLNKSCHLKIKFVKKKEYYICTSVSIRGSSPHNCGYSNSNWYDACTDGTTIFNQKFKTNKEAISYVKNILIPSYECTRITEIKNLKSWHYESDWMKKIDDYVANNREKLEIYVWG